jgi:hypothetical protein
MKYRMIAVMSIAMAVLLLCSFPTVTAAQSDAARALYVTSATVPTKVAGVNTYLAAPAGFNPLEASDEALATYGFPPRPDSADPRYKLWARAMGAAKYRKNEGKVMPISSTELKPAKQPEGASAITGVPTLFNSFNWSGVAVTNSITKWSKAGSFGFVISISNVPVAQPPFNACTNGVAGPFYEVSWNGIDGAFGKQGDVVQGGSLSYSDCGGAVDNFYCGWVEWFPSYPVICEFLVNPGDDIFVESFDTTGGFNPANVFVEDLTTNVFTTVSLTYKSGPPELGDSAEWIVERPCCVGPNSYPLNNYVDDFFVDSFAENAAGTKLFYPGSTTTTTQLISMVDDGDTQHISLVNAGTSGIQGRYSLWFEAVGCALNGGCVP